MKLPLQITFRHMQPSEAVEADIREHAGQLDRFADDIMSCRVVFEAPHHHHRKGNLYHVSIDVKIPDHELAVTNEHDLNHAHEDPYVAIRDTFDALRRRLQDLERRKRGKVKHHEVPAYGKIQSLFPAEDYGRILSSDGREVYFHRHSLVGEELERLKVGDEVRFHEEAGEEGPQASTVLAVGKHHIVE
jgi:ribosome-associated translation inhibitor RaiA/cold shock CspA family protein